MRIKWEYLRPFLAFLLGIALIVFLIYKDRKFPHGQIGEREQAIEPEEEDGYIMARACVRGIS
jgi:hypothetical protein